MPQPDKKKGAVGGVQFIGEGYMETPVLAEVPVSSDFRIDMSTSGAPRAFPDGDDDDGTPCTVGSPMKKKVFPIRITCEEMGYVTRVKGKVKEILRDINITYEPSQLGAIMGPSGSGKTSFLHLLHGDRRYLKGRHGDVKINGQSLTTVQKGFRKVCSLVPQEDILLPSFTVRETMLFAAYLRLPPDLTHDTKVDICEKILRELGIGECGDVIVGGVENPGISGGQRRRVSIGLELVVNPSVLLLDEPTSGLDSKTAEDLCLLLRQLTKTGRMILCSIHQPSFKIFSNFHNITFLARGRLIYNGPFQDVDGFFQGAGLKTPQGVNPADFYMRALQTDSAALADSWEAYRQKKAAMLLHSKSMRLRSLYSEDCGWVTGNAGAEEPTAFRQFFLLFVRMLADNAKDSRKLLGGMVMEAAVGVLIGVTWLDQDPFANASIFAFLGVFIMLTTICIFDSMVSLALKFPVTRSLHFREYNNGYYSLLPYYFATVCSALVLTCAYQIPQAIIVFFMVGLDFSSKKFGIFVLVLWLASVMGAFIGFIVSTFTTDFRSMQETLTPLLMPLLMFSGYMLPYPTIPNYLKWVYYLSMYQYVFSALAKNHFSDIVFRDCTPVSLVCYRLGTQYLEIMGMTRPLWHDLMAMGIITIGLVFIGFFSLQRVS